MSGVGPTARPLMEIKALQVLDLVGHLGRVGAERDALKAELDVLRAAVAHFPHAILDGELLAVWCPHCAATVYESAEEAS